MKKKTIVIISLFIIVLLSISAFFIIKFNRKNNVDYNLELINSFNYINNLSKNYNNKGKIKLIANYRGAHGEHNPVTFNYDFKIDDNKLYIGNNNGYNILDNVLLIDVLNSYSKIKNDIIISSREDNDYIYYELDSLVLSDIFKRNIKEVYFKGHKAGLFKNKIDKIELVIDNEIITFDSSLSRGEGKLFGKDIKYIKSNMSISLQYSDDLRINILTKDNRIEYNIVDNSYTYKINLYDDKVEFYVLGDASIYRGLEMTIEFSDIEFNEKDLLDKKEIPIIRYFEALGNVGSEY